LGGWGDLKDFVVADEDGGGGEGCAGARVEEVGGFEEGGGLGGEREGGKEECEGQDADRAHGLAPTMSSEATTNYVVFAMDSEVARKSVGFADGLW
jgi:hypothetical protein